MKYIVRVYMAVLSLCMVLFNLYTNFSIHHQLKSVIETTRPYNPPTHAAPVHREPLTNTSVRRVILAFPYNGERVTVARRLAQSPHALYVVSESPYGHNGLLKQMHWHKDFPVQSVEYMRLGEKLFKASSPNTTWFQEVMARTILGQGVRNMYVRGEISDNDVVVVTDADEVVSPEALVWLQTHLQHDVVAVAGFRWFLWTHCYEYPQRQHLKVATTVQTLRVRLKWDAHLIRKREHGLHRVSIGVSDAGSHCSWCFGNGGIREKMRVNIETSSWVSHGTPRVYSDKQLDHLRATGTWFDGVAHGPCRCSPAQIASEMALENEL